ncbi:hypothetical protein [Phenylobacterium sp.]|uniref:hypothetical protein n=1 Tax=Phenylobacterium sp. TaxID=1871053 RepID=UPI0035B20087
MASRRNDVAGWVAAELRARSAEERGLFLRELLAHTAAGLVVLEGEAKASEAVYRLADAVVAGGRD